VSKTKITFLIFDIV